ncbi:efflux RND transporter permease subunit, partial [Escherichia coli]
VSVSANYPGADAQTVQDTVTQVIAQNMNGIDNLMSVQGEKRPAGLRTEKLPRCSILNGATKLVSGTTTLKLSENTIWNMKDDSVVTHLTNSD